MEFLKQKSSALVLNPKVYKVRPALICDENVLRFFFSSQLFINISDFIAV